MVRALTEEKSKPKGDNCGAEFACANIESQQPAHVDRVINYGLTCVQLGIMLMQLNDTEKEGDGQRCLINWKLLMLYFRSRNQGMKYALEAMRLLTCTKALFIEQIAHTIIYGQY